MQEKATHKTLLQYTQVCYDWYKWNNITRRKNNKSTIGLAFIYIQPVSFAQTHICVQI